MVDDGSTDNTAAVVAKIQDPRLCLIRQRNQGQSVALNRGVNKARGLYIKLLDADDYLNPTHIEAQLEAINSFPNYLASCRWGYFIDDPTNPKIRDENSNRDYEDPLEWIIDSLTKDEGMMGGWMWLISRKLWDKCGGYDTRLSLNNDFHFSINLLLASEGVKFANDAIYSYRKGNSGALSTSVGSEAMESAYLTTELATQCLLDRENSKRIRSLCADRFQQWLFKFYPEFPALVKKTERQIENLGGSKLGLSGGQILRVLSHVLGWKRIREIQCIAYRLGWQMILKLKAKRRRSLLR